MPELPEVRTVAKYLNLDIAGKKIKSFRILLKKMLKNSTMFETRKLVENQIVKNVNNVGKYLLMNLSNDYTIISHLRMEGKYRFESNLDLQKHDHAYFQFKNGYLIFADVRQFATFEITSTLNILEKPPLKKLGNLAEKTNLSKFVLKMLRKRIAIKTALLDQSNLVGLGNIYVDEVLWHLQIHPQKPANQFERKDYKKILQKTTEILNKATQEEGSSIRTYLAYNQIKGNYQNFLKVHTKVGKPCARCQTIIIKIKVNGRGTYLCLTCQPPF